jgi:hypothetical protein
MSIRGSLGGSINISNFLNEICVKGGGILEDVPEMMYFNHQLTQAFNPDINGYSLCFMVPPPFKALDAIEKYDQEFIDTFRKLTLFSSVDFNPPQRQIQSEKFAARSGGIPYATEMDISPQCSISYIDNYNLDIFNFHNIWFDFMHEMLLGYIEVPSEYLNPENFKYGGLDYAGAMFVMKYEPSMQKVRYLGKATGIYPQTLPNKEIIGTRSTNEIPIIPLTYSCAWYEETLDNSHPIWREFEGKIAEYFSGAVNLPKNNNDQYAFQQKDSAHTNNIFTGVIRERDISRQTSNTSIAQNTGYRPNTV